MSRSILKIANPAVPIGSLVVVTGATGFIGSHVVNQLLASGYAVRGVSRNADSNRWVEERFRGDYPDGKFELVTVEDMEVDGAYDEACRGAQGFIHVAHDMQAQGGVKAVLERSQKGALNAAKGAYKEGIRRFVYTSSSFAITQPKPNVEFTVDEDTFNEEAVKKVQEDPNVAGQSLYSASKVLTERALRAWQKEEASDMVINTLNPNANIGPMIDSKRQGYPTSAQIVAHIARQDYDKLAEATPEHYINVMDDAKLHIVALVKPDLINRRVFAMKGPFSFPEIVDSLRRSFPDKKFKDFPNTDKDLSIVKPIKEVEGWLREGYGHGYTSMDETIKGNAQDILA